MDFDPDLTATVERRLEAHCATIREQAAAGDPAYQRLLDEGHLEYYRREIAFIRKCGANWKPT
jgi:hypothetical protein